MGLGIERQRRRRSAWGSREWGGYYREFLPAAGKPTNDHRPRPKITEPIAGACVTSGATHGGIQIGRVSGITHWKISGIMTYGSGAQ
jgi:hypothetical protein